MRVGTRDRNEGLCCRWVGPAVSRWYRATGQVCRCVGSQRGSRTISTAPQSLPTHTTHTLKLTQGRRVRRASVVALLCLLRE